MTNDHEALLALSEALYQPLRDQTYFQRQPASVVRQQASFLAQAVLASGHLIHRSKISEETARAGEGVPEGWKLVPAEPTDRMTFLGQSVRYNYEWGIGAIYRHMLAAAPALPLTEEAGHAER